MDNLEDATVLCMLQGPPVPNGCSHAKIRRSRSFHGRNVFYQLDGQELSRRMNDGNFLMVPPPMPACTRSGMSTCNLVTLASAAPSTCYA